MRQVFYLPKYRWMVVAWYLDGEPEVNVSKHVINDMRDIGLCGRKSKEATKSVLDLSRNNALTYSNMKGKSSIIVIGRTSSTEEFADSLMHEMKHLESHISKVYGIDPFSEEAAYLSGDIAKKMFRCSHKLLCEGCRKNII